MSKHYAIADIHGMYDIYEQVCDMITREDIVYFLGDAGDRGYDCFKCIKAIYDNPQWVYLKGNHEDMMAKTLDYFFHPESCESEFSIWMANGGYSTWQEWEKDGSNEAWRHRLHRLPTKATYINDKGITFHMSHAGFTLQDKDWQWGDDLIWNRSHFFAKWNEEKYPNDIVIHGHTPLLIMVKRLQKYEDIPDYVVGQPEARVYCNGHKINIDNAVFHTGSTVLYDLDEMKAIPLFDRKFKDWKEAEEDDD